MTAPIPTHLPDGTPVAPGTNIRFIFGPAEFYKPAVSLAPDGSRVLVRMCGYGYWVPATAIVEITKPSNPPPGWPFSSDGCWQAQLHVGRFLPKDEMRNPTLNWNP